ncbi:MAG: hypothetical protein ACU0DW_11615, partial [Shimia sp.]
MIAKICNGMALTETAGIASPIKKPTENTTIAGTTTTGASEFTAVTVTQHATPRLPAASGHSTSPLQDRR